MLLYDYKPDEYYQYIKQFGTNDIINYYEGVLSDSLKKLYKKYE